MLWLAKVSEGSKSGSVVISTSTLFTLTQCIVSCVLSCNPPRPFGIIFVSLSQRNITIMKKSETK